MLSLIVSSEPSLGITRWIFFVSWGYCFKWRFSSLYGEQITSAFYIAWETPKCCPSPSHSGVTKQRMRQLSSQKSQRDLSLCPLLPLAPINRCWREEWCDITSIFLFFIYLFISREDFLTALVSVSDQNAMPRSPEISCHLPNASPVLKVSNKFVKTWAAACTQSVHLGLGSDTCLHTKCCLFL